MSTRGQNIEAIERALGEPWARTRQRLEEAGGATATHTELAEALYPQLAQTVTNHGWWVQGAVVAYEQEIGRRLPGQRADGTFTVAARRLLPGRRSAVIERFAALLSGGAIGSIVLAGPPRRSETPKRSYWRAETVEGTRLEAAAEPTEDDRALLVLTVAKLPSPEALEEWRTRAKELLARL
ncbi:hypothetical protein [Brachybacterium hainanense]|uniref:DUF4287 domain-containing protein n=1 Tax=Brachybacterium hainanense TaxID=1541174 RepID=A0ABV6R7M4_9MICO